MAAWLDNPFGDLYTDFLYPNTNNASSSLHQPPPSPPPVQPPQQLVVEESFQPFSTKVPQPPEASNSLAGIPVEDFNDSPAGDGSGGGGGSMPYSWWPSATNLEADAVKAATATTVSVEDMTKKGQQSGGAAATTNQGPCEDIEQEPAVAKKLKQSKRSQAAEAHNLSERRRRGKINEKMKEMRDLVPPGKKRDKVSMLVDTINYVRSLQIQVQMLNMGGDMVPPINPGMQPTGMATSAATSLQLASGPSAPVPMNPVPAPGFPAMRPGTLPNATGSSLPFPNPGVPQHPNVDNTYEQYLALQQMQMQQVQNQQMQDVQNQLPPEPASSSKPSDTGEETDDNNDGFAG